MRATPSVAGTDTRDGADPGDAGASGGTGGRARDVVTDALLFALALLWWANVSAGYLLVHLIGLSHYVPQWLFVPDVVGGAVGCLALWWRRSSPLAVAMVLCVVAAFSNSATAALVIALVGLAVRRPWQQAAWAVAVTTVLGLPWLLTVPPGRMESILSVALALSLVAASVGWGVAIRTRGQLVERLRADVRRERADRERRLEDARSEERRRIAREMHDVVAHRMSLLSVHAGALAYRTERAEAGTAAPLDAAELGAAVRVIRDNAHRALEELGGVLAVLRSSDTAPGEADDHAGTVGPAPGLADVGRLVEEAVAAGQRVGWDLDVPGGASPGGQVARTVYRVVQEGLTNTRKHAPGARVGVRVRGGPGRGLEVSVASALPVGVVPSEIPGAGAGLTGLAERVALEGGELVHGPEDGEFRLVATLPWPGSAQVP
ncbi:sensor histidine kinase [Nocardiopsis sp. NPDC058631]|uniref:sensor histidine kinase n=1 Tax=Nocardiopsis sp. NPDC058631 TaxID=3346566 RepID=UPI00364AE6D1